jgi:hypothetical protein
MATFEDRISNPFLTKETKYTFNDKKYDFTQNNLINHYDYIYILTKMNNDIDVNNLLLKYIDNYSFQNTLDNMILYKVDKYIIFEDKHFIDMVLINSNIIEKSNKFKYNLDEEILVLPIFDISFLNIQRYIDTLECKQNTLKNIYNTLVINNHFNIQITQKNKLYYIISDLIKNMKESMYWTIQSNCIININSDFEKRRFIIPKKNYSDIISTIELKKKNENYLDIIFQSQNYIKSKKFYFDKVQSEYSDEDIFNIYNILPEDHKKMFYKKILISKKYCHHILKSAELINEILNVFGKKNYDVDNIRINIGFAWTRLYLEETLKEGFLNTNDDIVFDIHMASRLPNFNLDDNYLYLSPYFISLINRNYVLRNLHGVSSDTANNAPTINNYVDFKKNLNIFLLNLSPENTFDFFGDIDFQKYKMAVCGSIMPACLLENNPLENIFNNKEEYFNEYYSDSDVDIMIKTKNPYEFIKLCHDLEKKFYDNHSKFFDTFEINSNINNTIYVYVKKEYISSLFPERCIDDINFSDEIINKLVDIIEEKYYKYIDTFKCDDKDNNIYNNINKFNKKNINILFFDKDHEYYENDIMIKLNIKCHMNSQFWKHQLEIFMIKKNDFMNIVSKFHLPCVRAYYDGNNVYMTPSCISALKTMTNLHYTYFSSNTLPMEIINKYRQRGFGTILNKDEIKMIYLYSLKSEYWKDQYNLKDVCNKQISIFTKHIGINSKFFRPQNRNDVYNYLSVNISNKYFIFNCDIISYKPHYNTYIINKEGDLRNDLFKN